MKIGKTFGVVKNYLRYFFFRADLWLAGFISLIIIYSFSFVGAFLLLFLGLRDFMGESLGVVDTGFWLVPQLASGASVNLGVALLGVSAGASLAAVFFAVRSAAQFGAEIVWRFQDRWDEISADDKKKILNTAAFATTYARLVLVSLVPFSVFVLGVVYLTSYNIYLGMAILVLGSAALFIFVPVTMISHRVSSHTFSSDISATELRASRPQLVKFLFARLDMFVSRRAISSANLLVLFLVIAIAFGVFGPERIVGLFNEQSLVVVLLARASLLSLTRMTICLRIANKKIDQMEGILQVLRDGKIPAHAADPVGFDDED